MTDKGKFISGSFNCNGDFVSTLINKDYNLAAGSYVVLVDPIWNETASHDEGFRSILVTAIGEGVKDLQPLAAHWGMNVFCNAIKDFALTRAPEENKDRRNDTTRIYGTDLGGSIYGYIYTINGKRTPLKETVDISIENFSVFVPQTITKYYIDLPLGGDHLIVMRNYINEACGFSWTSIYHPLDE